MKTLRHSPSDRPTPAAGLPSPRCHQAGSMAGGHSCEGQAVWRPCDTAPVTGQYLLQDFPLHDVLRQEAWPEDTPLGDKLCGDLASPLRTAAFLQSYRPARLAIAKVSSGRSKRYQNINKDPISTQIKTHKRLK